MRYPSSEKLEIIRLVERSHLPVKRTLDKLGIPRTSFYRWYDRYLTGGPEALEDRRSRPGRVWNRIPDEVRDRIVQLALDETDLSPRELAVRFTDMFMLKMDLLPRGASIKRSANYSQSCDTHSKLLKLSYAHTPLG